MLTASLVTYHTDGDELRRALTCAGAAADGGVTVVDNGREVRVEVICREAGADYVAAPNRGYGAGHNIALRRAIERGSNYHLVMNSDIEFDPAMLRVMTEFMDSEPDVVMTHPRIFGLDGADQYTARMLPTPFDLIVRRFLPKGLFARSRDRYLLKHLDRKRPIDVAYVQGSFMLIRVEALKAAGLFDERFFLYPEDIDLSRRLTRVGRVVYLPEATAVHAHRAASYESRHMMWIHAVNMVRYFNKWGWLRDPERRRLNARLR